MLNSIAFKLIISVLLVLPLHAYAAYASVVFINDTGAPATDFHFTVDVVRIGFTPPVSIPWGTGVAENNGTGFDISYSGSPIGPLGVLTFPDLTFANVFGANAIFSDFTWTPSLKPATPSNVPVPAAAWLFGSGLLGLIGGGLRHSSRKI